MFEELRAGAYWKEPAKSKVNEELTNKGVKLQAYAQRAQFHQKGARKNRSRLMLIVSAVVKYSTAHKASRKPYELSPGPGSARASRKRCKVA
jgi:hypothetical protein